MKKIFLAILSISILVSCSKDDAPSNQAERPVDFYAAGCDYPETGNAKAVLWKNGEPTYLTDGNYNAYAYSVFVELENTHVVGFENNIGKYWKNGVDQTTLTPPADYFTKVQVINDKVYILGKVGTDIVLWEDGVPTIISGFVGTTTYPCDFKVVGNDKYVLINSDNSATLWKNGVNTVLSDGVTSDTPRDLCVTGNNVYVLAEEYYNGIKKIKYWKNGVINYINNTSNSVYAFNIDVNNNNVYIGGSINSKAHFWKNGVATQIGSSTGNSYCYGMQVLDNNVFTVNKDNGKAKFLKNISQLFIDNVSYNSDPNECFVIYK
ncbi:hypothetical protein [Flavobacterium sasangense]|uniref:hypothetical protein n=1 Tax=Flavobacterium sasangense TaxID=503361 RepID=UPI00047DB635|nr:hypothetical protein [Flavobacterium sasangense]